MTEYLTTKELADLLRIKERKVYDLAASGEVPCAKAMGKLLFPRAAIEAWLAANTSGGHAAPARPGVFLGSHDPLLEWALTQSRCGLAIFFDSSRDGLDRFAAGEGIATGLHLFDPATGQWNTHAVSARFAGSPLVLVEWAQRQRGLIVPPALESEIKGLADLKGRRVAPRQREAGSQELFDHLLRDADVDPGDVTMIAASRTENDAAVAIIDGKADATFGLAALAARYRLGFVPVIAERFDILVDRRAWFEPAMQTLLAFCRSDAFAARASELEGYDISGLGQVHFNGG